jgi:hypothetical protein
MYLSELGYSELVQWLFEKNTFFLVDPLQKHTLKSRKRMHSRQTRNNIPGSVPQITPTAPCQLISNPPPTPIIAPRQSPRTANPNVILANPNVVPAPTWILQVRFVPVKGGLGKKT